MMHCRGEERVCISGCFKNKGWNRFRRIESKDVEERSFLDEGREFGLGSWLLVQ